MEKTNQLLLPFELNQVSESKPKPTKAKKVIHASELRKLGISSKDTTSVEAILELGNRYQSETATRKDHINNPGDVYHLYKDEMQNLTTIKYNIIAVNTKHCVTDTKLIAEPPEIKQVMRWAVSRCAAAFFLCRNHLDYARITELDKTLVDELTDAGTVIGIGLLDYLIIGTDRFISLREQGIL